MGATRWRQALPARPGAEEARSPSKGHWSQGREAERYKGLVRAWDSTREMAEVEVKMKVKVKAMTVVTVPRQDRVASACTLFRHCYAAYVNRVTMQYFLVALRSYSRLV